MLETFKWQSANCVWAQLVTQYPSAPMSEFLFGVGFGQRSSSCPQFDASLALALSQYLVALVRSSRCCLTQKLRQFFLPICSLEIALTSHG